MWFSPLYRLWENQFPLLLVWLGWERICLQCGRPGFNPWVRKIPLEKGMAIHSTVLAWRIPRTEAIVDGLRKSWYDWGANTFHFLLAKLWSGCWVSCVRLNPESAPSVNYLGQFVSAHCSLVPFAQLMSMLWFVFQRPRQETACIFTPQHHLWGPAREEYFLLSSSSWASPRILGVRMGSGDCLGWPSLPSSFTFWMLVESWLSSRGPCGCYFPQFSENCWRNMDLGIIQNVSYLSLNKWKCEKVTKIFVGIEAWLLS